MFRSTKFCFYFLLLTFGLAHSAYAEESVAEKVLKSGTLRCGYTVWAPAFIKDPKTGTTSGVYHDIIVEMARRLSLKVEWAEEPPLDAALTGITAGRYDMFCFPLYANSNRSREAAFSIPINYASIFMATRADETRLNGSVEQANDAQFRIAVLDGEITAILAAQKFPKAKVHTVPQTQGFSFVMKDIETGKADFTITDPKSLTDYNTANNNSLKLVGEPMLTNAIAFPLPFDSRFKSMIDTTLHEMLLDGYVESIIRKYDYTSAVVMPIKPYKEW